MAYGQSKLANILHAKELSRRLKVFSSLILTFICDVFIQINRAENSMHFPFFYKTHLILSIFHH